MNERILAAAREVARPMTFSTLIIGVAFLPLFTMTGVSGRHLRADGAHVRVRDRRRDLSWRSR